MLTVHQRVNLKICMHHFQFSLGRGLGGDGRRGFQEEERRSLFYFNKIINI